MFKAIPYILCLIFIIIFSIYFMDKKINSRFWLMKYIIGCCVVSLSSIFISWALSQVF